MVELTEQEQQIVEALKALGSTSEDKMKTADDVAKKAGLSKNIVANLLITLANKKVVKRTVRHKAAGYYLLPEQETSGAAPTGY